LLYGAANSQVHNSAHIGPQTIRASALSIPRNSFYSNELEISVLVCLIIKASNILSLLSRPQGRCFIISLYRIPLLQTKPLTRFWILHKFREMCCSLRRYNGEVNVRGRLYRWRPPLGSGDIRVALRTGYAPPNVPVFGVI
jgi:hypothetical protein